MGSSVRAVSRAAENVSAPEFALAYTMPTFQRVDGIQATNGKTADDEGCDSEVAPFSVRSRISAALVMLTHDVMTLACLLSAGIRHKMRIPQESPIFKYVERLLT